MLSPGDVIMYKGLPTKVGHVQQFISRPQVVAVQVETRHAPMPVEIMDRLTAVETCLETSTTEEDEEEEQTKNEMKRGVL